MNDKQLVALFLARDEKAVAELKNQYGRYAVAVADKVLRNRDDAEECENEAYLKVWNRIPPETPENLKTFLGKIVRNLAIDRLRENDAKKRGGTDSAVAIDEFLEILPDEKYGDFTEKLALRDLFVRFLKTLPKETRVIFLQRYWYLCTAKEIAANLSMTESAVNSVLHRTRIKMREYLEKEGIKG